MAKTQTFSDKLNKKVVDPRTTVKIIKGITSEIGSTRFIEKVMKIDDVGTLAKIDIN
jgi:hypothetical protein